MFELREAAKEYLSANQTVFGHNRALSIGSSEIGTCARKVAWSKLGEPRDEEYVDNVGFTGRGNVIEDAFAVPLMEHIAKRLGATLMYAGQKNQTSLVAKGVPLSATPDGLMTNAPANSLEKYGVADIGPSGAFGIEIKSLDDRFNKDKLPKSAHKPQVITALGLMRRALDIDVRYSLLFYVDTSDFTDIVGFAIEYEDAAFKNLVRRANQIMTARDANQFMPEGKINGGGDCRYCQYAKKCLGYLPYMPREDKVPDEKAAKQIEKAASKLKKLEEREETIKLKASQAEAELVARLTDAGTKFATVNGLKVSWTQTKSQDRADTAAMKAEITRLGGDPSKFTKATKPGSKISVERLH